MLMDVRAAARALSVSPRTVQNLAARGELPTVKIGKLTRYAVDDLQRLIDARRQAPQPIGGVGVTP
jgi:excisionase family DNA binding protein